MLIQHDDRHYDRESGQWAYVYSLYLHLQENQVFVNEGNFVNENDAIAQAGNTGNSTGDHLHLQIVVHPDSNREIEPENTLQSEARSRNPELWIEPYPDTARAVGKVTNANGNPVANLCIVGLQKQAGWGYGYSQTYSDADLKPDDILVENFATTDVNIQPGTYQLEARTMDQQGNCTTTVYEQLGTYTFEAGRTTYVGLDPVYLPDVREGSGWSSSLHVRNRSTTKTAQVNISFFQNNGILQAQQTHYINPNGTRFIDPPTGLTTAAVIASEDIAVSMLTTHSSPLASTAHVGVETLAKRVFIPLVHRQNSSYYGDWNSQISIFNPNPEAADVRIYFTPSPDGAGKDFTTSMTIPPYGRWRIYTTTLSGLGTMFIGSADIYASEPVAVADLQYRSNYDSLIGSSGAVETNYPLHGPLIQNNNVGWTSGFSLQSIDTSQSMTAWYYRPNSGNSCRSDSYWVSIFESRIQNPAPPSGCTGDSILSVKFTGSNDMQAQVNQLLNNGANPAASGYPGIAKPSQTATVPYVRDDSIWETGLQIRNTSSSSASVNVDYYYSNGNYAGSSGTLSIARDGTKTVYPVPHTGSAVVQTTNGTNIAVVVNHLRVDGASGDTLMTHIAPNQ